MVTFVQGSSKSGESMTNEATAATNAAAETPTTTLARAGAAGGTAGFSIGRELDALESEALRAQVENHLGELQVCLSQMSSYTIRDDSRLAYRYASGLLPTQPWSSVWTVAHEMACTQYLCDALPYQQVQQPFLKELAAKLKAESGVDWKHIWAAVAEWGPEILKLQLMGDLVCSGSGPLIFPDIFSESPASEP